MKNLILLLSALPLMAATADTFLITAVTIHPVTSADIPNASLLVIDGKIAEMGPKVAAPKGIRKIDAKGLHVYPGMINSATELGMSEIESVRETTDYAEIGDFKPQLRAVVAINPSSEHIPVVRANGLTSAIVLPGGGLIAGQAPLVHLDGWTWEDMQIKRTAAMHLLFPTLSPAGGRFAFAAGPRVPFAEAKRTYEKRVKELHDYLEEARHYQKAKAAGGSGFKSDLKMDAMLPILDRSEPLLVTAVQEREIKAAIEFADKENVKIILAGVRKPGAAAEEIAKKNIPVILGPTLALPLEEDDPYDSAFTLPGELHRAGVKFAFGSFGNQFARNVPFQAANAVAFGLPYEVALKAVTINPAEIWGVSDQIGSIDKGKLADLIVTDGDPLEAKTNVKMMFIKGRETDLESKHTLLYKKYLARP